MAYITVSGLHTPTSELIKFENALVQRCLESITLDRSPKVAIDVGAFIGQWAVPLAAVFDFVMAFEPISPNFEYLRKNTKTYVNVTCREEALSDREGEMAMYIRDWEHPQFWGFSNGLLTDKRTTVNTTTIDALGLEHIDFIKVNTNGSELKVLRGAERSIKKFRPHILVSEERDPQRLACRKLHDMGMQQRLVWDRNYLFGW